MGIHSQGGCPFYEHPILPATLLIRLWHWTWVYTTRNCKGKHVSSLGEPTKNCEDLTLTGEHGRGDQKYQR